MIYYIEQNYKDFCMRAVLNLSLYEVHAILLYLTRDLTFFVTRPYLSWRNIELIGIVVINFDDFPD